ncbi:MAG: hypothetical protein AAGA70_02130 [Pseudomonadota bacterium]
MESLLPVLSDVMLFVAALGAAMYCMVLSRRLARLNSVDKGLGGAIAVLSAQVDDLTKALSDARSGSEATAERLTTLMAEAETLGNEIEEMLAVSHDLEAEAEPDPAPELEPEATVQFGSRRVRETTDADATPVFRRSAAKEAAE